MKTDSAERILFRPDRLLYAPVIEMAVREDLNHGDITSSLTIPEDQQVAAEIIAKEPFVVSGLFVAEAVFGFVDQDIRCSTRAEEGRWCQKGDVIFECQGPCRSILAAERPALNILQRMCGISTLTRRLVQAVGEFECRIVDTRKTTPGLRILEKYAVRAGGGYNHRFDLSDGILIKDNHIMACGSVTEAVRRVRAGAPHSLRVEVEVSSLDELKDALEAGADAVLLDNMNVQELAEAVRFARSLRPEVLIEASGGVILENARDIAGTGVDIISSGALTHSARAVDISLNVV